MRALSCPDLWAGLIVYLVSLLGTLLLANEQARGWAVLLLIVAAVLAMLLWGGQKWISAFPDGVTNPAVNRSGFLCLPGLAIAVLFVLAADLRYIVAPNEAFGAAGILWLSAISFLLFSSFFHPHSSEVLSNITDHDRWRSWEIILVAGLFLMALLSRVWNLTNFPDNIYPDEIMTGTVATQAYVSPAAPLPSLFSTLWSGIDLPALWFWIVALFLKLGGSSLSILRLPAALFGAATVLPVYGLIRETWGRYAAAAGTAIMAFSLSNVHYSRVALNNITTQFFWATCFFFLLRGLRSRRRSDWAIAGLSSGLSEYFYYGTRLLPFLLLLFVVFVFAVHWQQARKCVTGFIVLACGYFVGFGPLLAHFLRNPNLYLGRGASLLIWSHVPKSFTELQMAWKTVWPVFSENLLGISTHSSQDIIFYAPLLLPAEAALLVLGVGLLLWHWRHPAAFLMLASGLVVLVVGGTLVAYPNSLPPLMNHWTPAFPAFYVALAVPVGAWTATGEKRLKPRLRWILPVTIGIALLALGYSNLNFYFHKYSANAETLKTDAYRSAQKNYEAQTAQSRYLARLGSDCRVFSVGESRWPYDPATTRFLALKQNWTLLRNPAAELSSINHDKESLAFLFSPGNEQYRELTHNLFPDGTDGEITTHLGKHLFYTYVLTSQQPQPIRK